MNKLVVSSLLSAVLGILTCGCVSTATAEFDKPIVPKHNPYDVPVRFYVDSLEVTSLTFGYEKSISDLKDEFYHHYPELFSDNRNDAIPVSFKVSVVDAPSDAGVAESLYLLLSVLSFCILPESFDFNKDFKITAQFEDMTSSDTFKLRQRLNRGWFGLHALFPHYSDPVFSTDSANFDFSVNIRIKPGKEKEIMQLFINQLYQLPRDKVQEIYLSRFGGEVEFME